jgi:uncharacterized membrane protein
MISHAALLIFFLQIIKDHVNSDGSGSHAFFSYGMWTCLAAMVLLFLGTIIVFFTCCTERRSKKNGNYREKKKSRHHHRDNSYTNNRY